MDDFEHAREADRGFDFLRADFGLHRAFGRDPGDGAGGGGAHPVEAEEELAGLFEVALDVLAHFDKADAALVGAGADEDDVAVVGEEREHGLQVAARVGFRELVGDGECRRFGCRAAAHDSSFAP